MGEQTQQIAERLRDRGEETVAFFEGLSPAEWEATVYTEGSAWDARQVLAHFVSAETEYLRVFRNVLDGGEGVDEDFSIDAFNEAEVALMHDTPAALIDRFRQVRAETVDLVAGMEDSDLDREGRHPFFGWDRMEKFVKLIYRHNMIHQRDIRRALDGEDAA